MSAYDDATLRRIASGDDTPREYRTLSRELAKEVLRLKARAARADSDAAGYLADHAAALLDLGAATSRAEKAEAAHATIQRVAREYFAALDTGNAHLAGAVIERDDPHYTALVIAEQAAEARLRALVGEGGR